MTPPNPLFQWLLNILIPKSDGNLISPYNNTQQGHKNTGNYWVFNEDLDCSMNSPCQHLREYTERSVENIHFDVRM